MLRTAGQSGKATPMADVANTHAESLDVEIVEKPSNAALKRIAADIDFSKPLKWDKAECMGEWYALVQKPPLHSVVAHIGPEMATQLLQVANESNRRLMDRHAQRLARSIQTENYELTGDTIKFSKSGRLLDGQHRLKACEKQKAPIISHVIFGLDDEVFDVLDQGKRRSPADILGLAGVESSVIVAGAVRWVMWYESGGKRGDEQRDARTIKRAALGPMKTMGRYAKLASQLHAGYKHPPSVMAGMLFLIGKHNVQLAEDFVQAWLHGNRLGRNKNFDVLSSRLQSVRNQSGGHLNNEVRAAMIIQCFNHWNANSVASPRALTWRKEWVFPRLEFDGAKFLSSKIDQERVDTSLKTSQMRILGALVDVAEGTEAKITQAELAERSNVPLRQLPDILRTLIDEKSIAIVKPRRRSAANHLSSYSF